MYSGTNHGQDPQVSSMLKSNASLRQRLRLVMELGRISFLISESKMFLWMKTSLGTIRYNKVFFSN